MDIKFIGEHLLPGQFGQFFIVLGFGAAVLSFISYYFSTLKDVADQSWKRIARISFYIQAFSVLAIAGCLFYIIYNHLFEYHYAWAHSSTTLPTHYMISCFWEGQEGSFLLWAFWQSVLGLILVRFAKSWEDSVMTFVSLSQVFILSMLLGVELIGQKIGSSPFVLLRNAIEGPIFSRPEYLSLIKDGNGLNPLLQNYWMVIHPPTLFLGFASMVVPFAFAMAGVWTKRYSEWIKPALPWALFAVMILGTGIIMGSFWAYEALNFGGFWAWDPVENASLIPWLTLIAAVHVMLAFKNSGNSYFTALFLTFISFILVLYASFLTRSGILGETSVHAFTDLGMSGQLVIYILIFLVIGIVLMVINWKGFPITQKDEDTYSREFWLFIGALVLTISCFQIIVTTSIPVFNALFNTKIAPPTNPIAHYNKWQLPIAFIVAFISAFSQFLKYKKTDTGKFFKKIGLSLGISFVITLLILWLGKIHNVQYLVLIFASLFSILANAELILRVFQGKIKLAGSAIAHIGFALILIGALLAASGSKVISINKSGFGYGEDFDEKNTRENVLLFKNEPIVMDDYTITYQGDSISGPNTYYKVNYQRKDAKTGVDKEQFTLLPNAQINPKMGLIASPDTKHYLLHDVYTHVTSVPVKNEENHEHKDGTEHSEDEDYLPALTKTIKIGDTINLNKGVITLKGLNRNATLKDIKLGADDLAVGAMLEIEREGKIVKAEPVFIIKGGLSFGFPVKLEEEGLKISFDKIIPEQASVQLVIREKKPAKKDFIIMKAIMFPYINLLWGGTIIMIIGFILSIFQRSKPSRIKADGYTA